MQSYLKPKQKTNNLKLFKVESSMDEDQKKLRKIHNKLTEKLTQDEKSESKQEREETQESVVCCCGDPGCRIGPYVPDKKEKKRK